MLKLIPVNCAPLCCVPNFGACGDTAEPQSRHRCTVDLEFAVFCPGVRSCRLGLFSDWHMDHCPSCWQLLESHLKLFENRCGCMQLCVCSRWNGSQVCRLTEQKLYRVFRKSRHWILHRHYLEFWRFGLATAENVELKECRTVVSKLKAFFEN